MQGDVVNTSSRMCSNGLPWRIQLHPSTVVALRAAPSFPTGTYLPRGFRLTLRGPTVFKGKGIIASSWVRTTFLDRAIAREFPGESLNLDVAEGESPRPAARVASISSSASMPVDAAVLSAPSSIVTHPTASAITMASADSSLFLSFSEPAEEAAYTLTLADTSFKGMTMLVSAVVMYLVAIAAAAEHPIASGAPSSLVMVIFQATSAVVLVVLLGSYAACSQPCCRSTNRIAWGGGALSVHEGLALACSVAAVIAGVAFVDSSCVCGFVDAADALACFLVIQSVSGTRSLWTLTGNVAATSIFVAYAFVAHPQSSAFASSIVLVVIGGAAGWALGRHYESAYRTAFAAYRLAENRHSCCVELLQNMLPSRSHVLR